MEKNLRKSYSITKYGEKLAWELALKTKQEFIKKLKEMNIGFTEDHGT